ncbi:PRC-barrel domain-containing protein [Dongia soli]|uniref:PRC-barrel domain-containing protein n=1 Tax=Dongia soli TaxID=600628 RepID=A0ABU5EHF1_9PROT|nr:PRC-barrel domain-containing protein [Dongia soli]MDY0884838.1 PRC-barrel domain-containing protein [Dongia soli]
MKRELLMSGVVACMLAVTPAMAQSTNDTNQPATQAPAATAPAVPADQQPSAANETKTNDATTDVSKGAATAMKNTDGTLNASQIIGLKVTDAQNNSVGKVSEVLMGENGRAEGVVVDVGGILGVGSHPVRLGWKDLKLSEKDGKATASVNISSDELKAMPAYKTAAD